MTDSTDGGLVCLGVTELWLVPEFCRVGVWTRTGPGFPQEETGIWSTLLQVTPTLLVLLRAICLPGLCGLGTFSGRCLLSRRHHRHKHVQAGVAPLRSLVFGTGGSETSRTGCATRRGGTGALPVATQDH